MSSEANSRDRIRLEPSWLAVLGDEFGKPGMTQLKAFLLAEKRAGKEIYPPADRWFHALDATPFDRVEVVILGQDPYHGPGQAHGLSFSVPPGVPVPPSLANIYRELNADLGHPIPRHGCLEHWARQGVLLLNAVLTVERGQANAHQGRGWEQFTDACIARLDRERENLVFLLWGSYAQRKGQLIDRRRHLVLEAPHPSPLSAHRGFLGCRHFSRANRYLAEKGRTPIDWSVPPAS